MPYVIGMILGDVLGRIGFFRATGAALMLGGTGFVAHRLVGANVSPDAAWVAGIVAPLGLFGWAAWHPAASRLRLWIVDGVYLAARLAMWWALVAFGLGLVSAGFHVGPWLMRSGPWLPVAGVFWAMQWALGVQVARSHRIMGERSVVEV